jgi:hypothetical protein
LGFRPNGSQQSARLRSPARGTHPLVAPKGLNPTESEVPVNNPRGTTVEKRGQRDAVEISRLTAALAGYDNLEMTGKQDLATALTALVGGADVLAARALEALARANAFRGGDAEQSESTLRLAGRLAETAWFAEPNHPEVRLAWQEVFTVRATAA